MAGRPGKYFLFFLLILAVIGVYYYFTVYTQPVEPQSGVTLDTLEDIAIPQGKDGQIIKHEGYTLCYSEADEQPYWAAYVLTPQETVISAVKRQDNFREDPIVSTGSATLKDYKGSGYDRGHMVPFADLSWSEESGSQSFYLSNMSPQTGALNRGAWAELESIVRTFSLSGPVCVVTGPVLNGGPFKTIGINQVTVPEYYYKVVLDYYGDEVKAIGFVMPNAKCEEPISSYAVSVDYVESITGIDFFAGLEDNIENSLESSFDVSLWDFTPYSSAVCESYGYDSSTVQLSDVYLMFD